MSELAVQPRAVDGQIRNSAVNIAGPEIAGIVARIYRAHRLVHRKCPGGGNHLADERRICPLIFALPLVRRAAKQIHIPAEITDQQ